jgi:hypothetical protein
VWRNTPRSGQYCDVVPLAREIFNPLDSGLRRNDVALSIGYSRSIACETASNLWGESQRTHRGLHDFLRDMRLAANGANRRLKNISKKNALWRGTISNHRRSMKQTVLHRLPLLLPERDALIPLRHFSAPIPPLVGAFSWAALHESFDKRTDQDHWDHLCPSVGESHPVVSAAIASQSSVSSSCASPINTSD